MTWDSRETIVAPASAPGGAARSIVRAGGDLVPDLIAACFRTTEPVPPSGRPESKRLPHLIRGHFLTGPALGDVPCQVLVWPTRRSYTGQRAAEFHLVGGPPIVAAAVDALCRAGARLAAPGEFTLRAFLAGRLDLTQAEAVLGVIHAESQRELTVALRQLGGGLAGPLDDLRNRLLDLLAHLEAGLDFVEEDLEFLDREDLIEQLRQAELQVRQLVNRLPRRTRETGELRVVLRGLPNSGKSSLLNALLGETRALVSHDAGTTRDYVCGTLDLDGYLVGLIDTAGVDESAEPGVAQLAQQSTSNQFSEAHLELFCLDSSRPRSDWEISQLAAPPAGPRLVVLTKQDLARDATIVPVSAPRSGRLVSTYQQPAAGQDSVAEDAGAEDAAAEDVTRESPGKSAVLGSEATMETIATSSLTGFGLVELREAMRRRLAEAMGGESEVVQGTAIRCQESLRRALECLELAHAIAQQRQGEELIAAELRLALDELGRVVGAVYTDDVLDRIFSRFCIGK